MNKFLLVVAVIVLSIIALANIGPMIGMAISIAIVYFSLKEFMKTDSTGMKILWALIGCIGLSGLISNIPALFGAVAVYLLYTICKNWESNHQKPPHNDDDPFEGFERQWKELEKNRV